MPRIITMHPVRETNRYGFETTQLYRAKVARNLNVDYLHLASAPQIRDNWKEDIKKLGFLDEEIVCVPFSYSDIAHKDPSMAQESFISLKLRFFSKTIRLERYFCIIEMVA